MQINAHSSRSHCLLVINVIGTNKANGVRTVGKLTLCDLAGSERIQKTGASGEPSLSFTTCQECCSPGCCAATVLPPCADSFLMLPTLRATASGILISGVALVCSSRES